jgi:hypothetical protein
VLDPTYDELFRGHFFDKKDYIFKLSIFDENCKFYHFSG